MLGGEIASVIPPGKSLAVTTTYAQGRREPPSPRWDGEGSRERGEEWALNGAFMAAERGHAAASPAASAKARAMAR